MKRVVERPSPGIFTEQGKCDTPSTERLTGCVRTQKVRLTNTEGVLPVPRDTPLWAAIPQWHHATHRGRILLACGQWPTCSLPLSGGRPAAELPAPRTPARSRTCRGFVTCVALRRFPFKEPLSEA
jgi:hypothetical protein